MRTLLILFKKRSPLLFFFAFLFMQHPLRAQETLVAFSIVNSKKEAVPSATINIVNKADTTKHWNKIADSSGKADFNLIKGDRYLVRISSVNYQFFEKQINITGNQKNFFFTMEPLPKILNAVTITSSRPLMRQEDDKTIVDPENLVAMSTSGYEVLEKTPGLFIDQDGNVYISSMTPATVYINGRDMKMSAADMATLLKNLPPNAISKIEILRTPSAKYDASSSGGIVNVVLKRGVKIGKTGSIHTGIQQGTYGNQFIGINMNNNDGKKNSYINLNYSRRNSYENIVTNRLFAADTILSQDAKTKYLAHSFYAGYGLGDSLGKNWDINFSGNISYNNSNNSSYNESSIKKISTSQLLADNLSLVNNTGSSLVISNGVDGKMKVDTLGSEWDNTIFYSYAYNPASQLFSTDYTYPSIPATGGDGAEMNKRNYFYLTSDLKLKTKKRFIFESGIKSSYHQFENNTNYFTGTGSNRSKDFQRTNTFHYTENINAGYLQGSQTFGKDAVIKFGARLENTNMVGKQVIPFDTSFAIHRTDLFPYVYLSKNIMKIAGYDLRAYLVYRRTISRPSYDYLNPFPKYVDQYLYETGNPSLRPQFTNNYEANISIDERPIVAIGMNDTKDIFTNVMYQSDSSRSVAYKTYDNLGKNKEVYARVLGAIPPGKKYFFVVVVQYNHNFYQGQYENQPLSYKRGSWTFFTYQSLKLGKHSQLSLHGFMRLKGQQQFYELSPFGSLNASINRKFLKDKLTLTLSMIDIFFMNKNNFTIRQGSVDAYGTRQTDSRRAGLNIRYNFGIPQKEKKENKLPDIESQ
ncbi:MAG: outer membrane beta-barrel protein [Bacteroidetes bacterium]|nr:outer membrane beta-barrel protein [Bacteroidota bacterium]MBS1931324.1 outer membrane beta-barrel protein [Bacteroidota bacterium]